jgi:hypothetical protein
MTNNTLDIQSLSDVELEGVVAGGRIIDPLPPLPPLPPPGNVHQLHLIAPSPFAAIFRLFHLR